MIRNDEVFKIGYIAKQRGLRGEVEMNFTDDCFDEGGAPYFVLDIDGILVPFFWEEYRFKNDEVAIVKFEDVDNGDQSKILVGRSVYYPKKHVAEQNDDGSAVLSSYKALTGYTVSDQRGDTVGTIVHVDDSSANTLLTIEQVDGEELMLPFHNDFLLDFNLQKRTLQLSIPDELLHLNK